MFRSVCAVCHIHLLASLRTHQHTVTHVSALLQSIVVLSLSEALITITNYKLLQLLNIHVFITQWLKKPAPVSDAEAWLIVFLFSCEDIVICALAYVPCPWLVDGDFGYSLSEI
jgi:hypothetical protein